MAMPGVNAAHSVPEIHPVCAPLSLYWAVMDREHYRIALAQRGHHRPRLHERPLLGQDEFAAGEVASGLGQQDGELQREYMRPVEVLMQAVVVAGAVLQHERCRPSLAPRMAAFDELRVLLRKASLDAHGLVPG